MWVVDRSTPRWCSWAVRVASEIRQRGVAGLYGSLTGIHHVGVFGSQLGSRFREGVLKGVYIRSADSCDSYISGPPTTYFR